MNPLRVAARSRDDFHIYYIYAYKPVIEAYGMEHKLYQMQKQIELQSLEIRNGWYLQEKNAAGVQLNDRYSFQLYQLKTCCS